MPAKFAEVVFPFSLQQVFTYSIPSEFADEIQAGARVLAPFGARTLTGFVVRLSQQPAFENPKPLLDMLDADLAVNPEIFRLCEWMAAYYMAALGEALRVVVPAGLLQASRQFAEINGLCDETEIAGIARTAPRQADILKYLVENGRTSVDFMRKKLGGSGIHSSLNALQDRGLVHVFQKIKTAVRPKVERLISLSDTFQPGEDLLRNLKTKAPKQAACLKLLQEQNKPVPQTHLLQKTGASGQTISALENKNFIRITEREVIRRFYDDADSESVSELTLTLDQQHAVQKIVEALDEKRFETFLLFGVTGSGKTQVYIEAIKRCLAQGKDAIVLVPEIALTPQTVRRFQSHFGNDVSVLHSGMSDGERLDSWRTLQQGKARVAIGPRSAVFAPLPKVGLIIVDEEHEASYKQTDAAPRYHARDVAIVRAKNAGAVVVLGSATPSAESFYNAETGKYQILELRKRVNDIAMPRVHLLDMQKERRLSGKRLDTIFSRLLAEKVTEKIRLREQIILLLNRRGYASFLKCRDCDYVEECVNCNIALTYHMRGNQLRCHYCGYAKPAPKCCPTCLGPDIIYRGLGTQKVEDEIARMFPEARTVRMDLDTTSRKRSHDRILGDFGAGKYDILLGTQMVAKGLDFSRVTLVGVINADIGMLLPDFRSTERTFQLLTQVAGRAGRKELTGEVIIQTYMPESFCLQCAQTHDFLKFYRGEIMERGDLNYPPFGRVICIRFRGEREHEVVRAADEFASRIKSVRGPFQVLGPSPSPISRIQNNFRYQVLVKTAREKDPNGRTSRAAVSDTVAWFTQNSRKSEVKISVDVDPVSTL